MASFTDVSPDVDSGLVSLREPRESHLPVSSLSITESVCHDQSAAHDNVGVTADFVAGLLGGSAGIFVGHPFDTIKVLQQTSASGGQTVTQCFKNTLYHEGVRGLFKGMAFPLVSIGFLNCLFFGLYGNMERYLTSRRGDASQTSRNYTDIFIAGGVAGAIQAIPASPIELVKVKLQTQTGKSIYRGPFDCLRQIYHSSGMRGCFHGLHATVWREVPGFTVYITSYHYLCDKLRYEENGSVAGMLFAGGMAGVFSWVVNIPCDVVKSYIQADNVRRPKYRGIVHCAKCLYQQEGYRVFWRGLPVTCMRAFPVNAVTFGVYTTSLKYLQQFNL